MPDCTASEERFTHRDGSQYLQTSWLDMEVMMLYPVYVHKDGNSAYGVTFPDFPGCFSAADELADLPRMAQEAFEVHFEGEENEIPIPSTIENLQQQQDYQDGFWLLLDIDVNALQTRTVRMNVRLPAPLADKIEDYAASHHISRDTFLSVAAERVLNG
jgi:predicted RNase H-like HicB family nuclease